MKKTASPLLACGALVLAVSMTLAGCNSAPPPRDLMAEAARSDEIRPVAMQGQADLTGTDLHVVATVARGFLRNGKPGRRIPEKHHWYQHNRSAFSENYSFDYGDSDEEQKEAVQAYIRQAMARRAAGSPMPPVTLHVMFENRGSTPVAIAPVEVDSDLGNFAARPVTLTIPAGATGSLDPMVSQLGVTSDDIPLTVVIQVGSKTFSQVIHVKNIIDAKVLKDAEAKR